MAARKPAKVGTKPTLASIPTSTEKVPFEPLDPLRDVLKAASALWAKANDGKLLRPEDPVSSLTAADFQDLNDATERLRAWIDQPPEVPAGEHTLKLGQRDLELIFAAARVVSSPCRGRRELDGAGTNPTEPRSRTNTTGN